MTRTETDLREALVSLASTADLPVRAPVPSRPRRPARVVAVAAVLVVGLAVVVLSVVRSVGGATSAPPLEPSATTSAAAPTATPTTTSRTAGQAPPQYAWFDLDPASGYTLTQRVDTPTVQSAFVALPDGRKSYVGLRLYAAGVFDPTSAQSGTPVVVQGTSAWRGPVRDPLTGVTRTADVWQYRPDAWAVVADETGLPDAEAAATLAAVAGAVRIADPAGAVAVPFTIGQVPTGLTVDVVYSDPAASPPAAAIGFADDRAGDPNRAQADGAALTVSLANQVVVPSGAPTTQVGGHPAWLVEPGATLTDEGGSAVVEPARELFVDYGGTTGYVAFSVDGQHLDRYGDDVLLALAAATTPVADVSDGATWVPAASGALR